MVSADAILCNLSSAASRRWPTRDGAKNRSAQGLFSRVVEEIVVRLRTPKRRPHASVAVAILRGAVASRAEMNAVIANAYQGGAQAVDNRLTVHD